ncbi:probable lipid kinase YegS-like [Filimonas sp.]|jgi:YegS/Rv2252/BmrU family lipid kinase|nr:probable lipid kinase YegS-like [Filimonas sp.]
MNQVICFIVNARIGEQKIRLLNEAIAQHMKHQKNEMHITAYGGHAKKLATDALAKGYKTIVAVGGDGTVNEIVQVLATTDAILGIVPTGSGNGLARHCAIPLNIPEAVQLLAEGHAKKIDLGKANEMFFISNAGVGFDAVVCNSIKKTKSRGLKMYISEVIRHYFSYRPDTYCIETDNETLTEKAFFLNVANGKEFGYGFEIASEATLQDGLLDMILVKKINAFNGFRFVMDGWRKKLITNKNCIYIRAKKIQITGSQLQYFQTDGDAHDCNGCCDIEVMPGALKLIVPKHIKSL